MAFLRRLHRGGPQDGDQHRGRVCACGSTITFVWLFQPPSQGPKKRICFKASEPVPSLSAVKAVITGNLGSKAADTLAAAGLKTYLGASGTVRAALQQYEDGQLQETSGASVGAHSDAGTSMGGGMGRGMGRGMGQGRGMGRGRGQGRDMGAGRGPGR